MDVLDLRDLKADLLERRENLDRRITRINNLISLKVHKSERTKQ